MSWRRQTYNEDDRRESLSSEKYLDQGLHEAKDVEPPQATHKWIACAYKTVDVELFDKSSHQVFYFVCKSTRRTRFAYTARTRTDEVCEKYVYVIYVFVGTKTVLVRYPIF